jgi:predicted MFS family arabinose efflux permease
VPPSRRPTVNGNRWSLLSIVMAVGGAGFGQLLDRIVFPLDFQVVFFLSFLAGMATLYTFSRIRMPEPDRAGVPAESGPPPREAFRWSGAVALVRASPLFTRFVVSSFVYRIGLNLPVALYSIYWVRDVQASNAVIGLRSSAASLVLIVSYLAWGRLAGRRGHRVVLLAASAGCSLYPLATALVSPGHAIWLIPVALIWGTFASGIDVSFFEALLHTCPRDRLQTFVGINSALANLVIFVAPIAGTLLGDLIGVRQALIAAAAFSLLGTALFYILAIAKEEVPAAVRVTG